MTSSETIKNQKLAAAVSLVTIVIAMTVVLVAFPDKRIGQTSVNTTIPTTDNTTPNNPASTNPSTDSNNSSPNNTPATAPSVVTASGYKNGTYSASGSYRTPESTETINVTVTLTNGVISAANISQQAQDRTSREYQAAFGSGYKSYVIGQNVEALQLSNVSGSSLTPRGFNAALTQIKAQAKV